MSHPHSQAGFWAGIPAGGKLDFVGISKHYGCPIAVWGWGRGGVYLTLEN